jgi:putative endonuclease
MNTYFVYIVTDRPRGVLYAGVTNDLVRRAWQHRNGELPGFTEKYGLKTLVWYESFGDIELAIQREKRIKRWRRAWKITLIEQMNPGWLDLWYDLNG